MDIHEWAAWNRDEHKKVDELSHNLRRMVGVIPRTNVREWVEDLRTRFEHFRAHMVRHMSLEEHEGYMSSVLECRPALSDVVERLRSEHGQVSKLMDGLHHALEVLEPDDEILLRDVCRRIQELIHCVEHHEAAENLLMISAFTNDIGTKD